MTALSDRLLDAVAAEAVREGLADALYAPVETPLGRLTVATGAAGVVRVAFPEEPEDTVLAGVAAGLGSRVLRAPRELRETAAALQGWLDGAADGDLELPVDLSLVTAPFRRRVLETLHAEVHRGATIGYGELAARAGSPGASRAVGSAMATNPVPVLVPCHRVLPASGAVGHYAGGVARKVALLRLERSLPSAAR